MIKKSNLDGRYISSLRKQNNLSREALAGKMSISFSSLRRLEQNKRQALFDEVVDLSYIFNVPISSFIHLHELEFKE